MNRRFGPGALRLGGLAARLLGWRPDHFWNATPAELAAILHPAADTSASVSRSQLNQLMERENG